MSSVTHCMLSGVIAQTLLIVDSNFEELIEIHPGGMIVNERPDPGVGVVTTAEPLISIDYELVAGSGELPPFHCDSPARRKSRRPGQKARQYWPGRSKR